MKVYFDKIKKLIWINSKIDLKKIKKICGDNFRIFFYYSNLFVSFKII